MGISTLFFDLLWNSINFGSPYSFFFDSNAFWVFSGLLNFGRTIDRRWIQCFQIDLFLLSPLLGYTFPRLSLWFKIKVLLLLLICHSPAFDSISFFSFTFKRLQITILLLIFVHRSSTIMNPHTWFYSLHFISTSLSLKFDLQLCNGCSGI